MFAKLFLRIIGIKTEDGGRVSEEQLRLLVAGAQKSGGIEKQEGEMISQVLNMQDRKVSHTHHAICQRRGREERGTGRGIGVCLSHSCVCACVSR
jgi:Mg2+/Co2+ transporter CorB